MAAGTHLRVRLVVGHVGMALHARRTVCAYFRTVDVVARGAFEMPLVLWVARNPMKSGELALFVTAAARPLRRYRPAMRLVAVHALPVPLWTLRELFFVTARASHHAAELVRRSFVARAAARMAQISAS